MNNPLLELDQLSDLIRQLHKIDAKMQAGQFIAAFRENRSVIAQLENAKKDLLASEREKSTKHRKIKKKYTID